MILDMRSRENNNTEQSPCKQVAFEAEKVFK